jgi:hypothetical protein
MYRQPKGYMCLAHRALYDTTRAKLEQVSRDLARRQNLTQDAPSKLRQERWREEVAGQERVQELEAFDCK